MSCQPNTQTHELAYEYLNRLPAEVVDHDRVLFDEIMADPFDGDHWGVGYDEQVKEGWTDSDDSSSEKEAERIITPLRERVGVAAQAQAAEDDGAIRLVEAEEMMRKLGEGYWRTGGRVVDTREVGQGWRAVSTGGSVASLALTIDGNATLGAKVSKVYSDLAGAKDVGES